MNGPCRAGPTSFPFSARDNFFPSPAELLPSSSMADPKSGELNQPALHSSPWMGVSNLSEFDQSISYGFGIPHP